MSSDDGSIFDVLGLDRTAALPEPPADVWSAALAHALDPDSPPVDHVVVPIMDDSEIDLGGHEELLLADPDEDTDSSDDAGYGGVDDGLATDGSERGDGHDHLGHEHDLGGHWGADEIDLGDGSDPGAL